MNDTTQLEKVRAEMVRRHENDLERAAQCIAELEKQLATEREAKMHETERAQTLMQERDRWKRECLETNRLDAGLQAELGKQLLEMKKERDELKTAIRDTCSFMVNETDADSLRRTVRDLFQMIGTLKDERDAARQSRARLVRYIRENELTEWQKLRGMIGEKTKQIIAAREEMKQAQARAGAYLHRANEAEQDAREMFDAIDAYLTEKKRLAYSAGYVLADETPDPNTLALSKLADMRIKHGAKYLKDGE